jgi:hypothetical protein
MKSNTIIVDIFESVVEKVTAAYGSNVRYMYGPVEEIEANLVNLTRAKGLPNSNVEDKYPLIALFQDFPEKRGDANGYYADVTIPIILIATLTDNKYKAPERYEHSFKPILYPIYKLFLQEMAKSGKIIGNDPDSFDHTKFDRLYYGRKTVGTALNDYVDAIEINNLRITVAQSC